MPAGGLAPALVRDEREHHICPLHDSLSSASPVATSSDRKTRDRVVRTVPEEVPAVECEPIALPCMPDHQRAMWLTRLDFEESAPPPWVLVGGQMTALHLAENGRTEHRLYRELNDRRLWPSLRPRQHSNRRDGPEELDRQKHYPPTGSGRPGQAVGGRIGSDSALGI